jgi:hypothetical protein
MKRESIFCQKSDTNSGNFYSPNSGEVYFSKQIINKEEI